MKEIKEKFKFAFTLVENLTVFTILGIIIALVVPSLMKVKRENNNKIALRKAVMTYEYVLKNTIISNTGFGHGDNDENDRIALNTILSSNGCSNTKKLLSVSESDSTNSCIFKTSDGIWWNISDPSNAIISLESKEKLSMNIAKDNTDKKTFYVPYIINNGKTVVLKTSENVGEKKTALSKTYEFLMQD